MSKYHWAFYVEEITKPISTLLTEIEQHFQNNPETLAILGCITQNQKVISSSPKYKWVQFSPNYNTYDELAEWVTLMANILVAVDIYSNIAGKQVCDYAFMGCTDNSADQGLDLKISLANLEFSFDSTINSFNLTRNKTVFSSLNSIRYKITKDIQKGTENIISTKPLEENCTICHRNKDVGEKCWWCGNTN